MKVLVFNSGSSSIKYQLFDTVNANEKRLAKGIIERIGCAGAQLTHESCGGCEYKLKTQIQNHDEGIKLVIKALTDPENGAIKSVKEINAIGHRVVHGGGIAKPVIIDDKFKAEYKKLLNLAPLHNPPALLGMEACERLMPGIPQVAVFDTAFHQTIPRAAYTYALPKDLCRKHKIRRYGFHGTSHKYVAYRAAEITGKDLAKSKIITCHLGNGASVTAIKNGYSIDTSMGLTPLEGTPMGTRCGSVDPAIIQFLMDREDMSIQAVMHILNKRSGVLGISGVSSDFRDLEHEMKQGNQDAGLAIDVFVHYVKKIIGSYVAVLNGLDILVFTAGLGENSCYVREKICEDMDYFGLMLDRNANNVRGEERIVSTKDSPVLILVVPTNEELMIVKETKVLLEAAGEVS